MRGNTGKRGSSTMVLARPFLSLLAMVILGPCCSLAQIADVPYLNSTDDEIGISVLQADDGGYILTGLVNTAAGPDVLLLKADSSGTAQWNRTFGGPGHDVGIGVRDDGDGNYVIVGWTNSSGLGGNDILLIKVDPQGGEIWSRTYGGAGDDYGRVVNQTSDGGYLVVGQTGSFGRGKDPVLFKTDSEGVEVWNRTYGGDGNELINSAQQTRDGGYAITGWTNSTQSGDWAVLLIKADENGVEEWNRTLSGATDQGSVSFQQTRDGGYIITGISSSQNNDVLLLKTDPYGRQAWNRTFGGIGDDQGRCVRQSWDGGYVVAGWTNSTGNGMDDVMLIKANMLGRPLWSRTYGGAADDLGRYLLLTEDGGFIISGQTRSFGKGDWDALLVKVDAEGAEEWIRNYHR